MTDRSYLDHASTSPVRPAAAQAMWEWLSAADPGRVHTEGRMARVVLEDARDKVAALLGTRSRQVIFTSGATEAINAAAFGVLAADHGLRPGVAVVSDVEHSAVREASQRWAASVVRLGSDRSGRIQPEELSAALGRVAPGTVSLVQCQLANHEVGTLQPVKEVLELCRRHGSLLHVDAAAAAGHTPIGFDRLGVDLMSVSAHKLGGPRGVGALLVRRGLRITPLILGGSQERARRGGLENLAAAVGFGVVAADLGSGGLEREAATAATLISRLADAFSALPDVALYGPADPAARLPHLLCIGVGGVEAEPVLLGLDQAGVAAHSGSSCSSETLEPSPVLMAMGLEAAHSLRFSVGWSTTTADVERAATALPEVVGRLRALRTG